MEGLLGHSLRCCCAPDRKPNPNPDPNPIPPTPFLHSGAAPSATPPPLAPLGTRLHTCMLKDMWGDRTALSRTRGAASSCRTTVGASSQARKASRLVWFTCWAVGLARIDLGEEAEERGHGGSESASRRAHGTRCPEWPQSLCHPLRPPGVPGAPKTCRGHRQAKKRRGRAHGDLSGPAPDKGLGGTSARRPIFWWLRIVAAGAGRGLGSCALACSLKVRSTVPASTHGRSTRGPTIRTARARPLMRLLRPEDVGSELARPYPRVPGSAGGLLHLQR